MHRFSVQPGNGDVDGLAHLWRQVCTSRGTPAPDAAHLVGFVAGLSAPQRDKLKSVLALAARGRDQPGDLALISWAASCTRPALLAQLAERGLEFTGPALFACGLVLRQDGWDMQARLAQLADHPEDMATLRAMLPGPAKQADEQAAELTIESPELAFDAAPLDEGAEPHWLDEPMDSTDTGSAGDSGDPWDGWDTMDESPKRAAFSSPSALPPLPTRFERETPPAGAAAAPGPQQGSGKGQAPDPRLRLRLFGKSAAHTLEVTDHRRGGDFMGTQVVSIDSAHALGAGGAYGWDRKLVLQLTPEEMPAIVATLMGITSSARFGNHGSDKSKFIEVRRQEGGLVVVTGDKGASYSVPVPTRTAYYVLDLFCRAMARDGSGRCVSDILALVRAAHGF